MLKYDDIRIDKFILAGSILRRDFDWITLFARDQVNSVRNEYGQKDPWPRWAGRLIARAGTGGSEGFEWVGGTVENVPCEWFGHSDSLMRQHIERHWVPALRRLPSPLALLHGRRVNDRDVFDQLLTHARTVIDPEVYGHQPHFEAQKLPSDLSLRWIRINPDIYTFLIDRGTQKPAGYINAMPVDDETYNSIRAGKLADKDIGEKDIVPFLGKQMVRVYIMSIAVAEQYRLWGDGFLQSACVQLLAGFLDKLTWYAKIHGIGVTHFLSIAWTNEGRRLCEYFGMTKVGEDQFGDLIYELDLNALRNGNEKTIPPPLRRLLKVYAGVELT